MKQICLLLSFLLIISKSYSQYSGHYYAAGSYLSIGPSEFDFFVAKDRIGDPIAIILLGNPRITTGFQHVFDHIPEKKDLITMELYPKLSGNKFAGFSLGRIMTCSNGIVCIEKDTSLYDKLSSIVNGGEYKIIHGSIDNFKFPIHIALYYDPNYRVESINYIGRSISRNEQVRRSVLLKKQIERYSLQHLKINIFPYHEQSINQQRYYFDGLCFCRSYSQNCDLCFSQMGGGKLTSVFLVKPSIVYKIDSLLNCTNTKDYTTVIIEPRLKQSENGEISFKKIGFMRVKEYKELYRDDKKLRKQIAKLFKSVSFTCLFGDKVWENILSPRLLFINNKYYDENRNTIIPIINEKL